MVIISKVKHPLKGYQGIVKNVLCRQETASGLQVAVQLSHLDPACPFKREILDYDDIVEASYMTSYLLFCLLQLSEFNSVGCKLFDFCNPKSKQFEPQYHIP